MWRITYVPDTFPQVSETFVLTEMRWFVSRGDVVTVVPRARGIEEAWNHDRAKELRAEIHLDATTATRPLWPGVHSLLRVGNVWQGKRPNALWRHLDRAWAVEEHAKRIEQHQTDVIVCHFGYDNAIAASIAGERLGVPVVQWLHGSDLYTVPHRCIRWFTDRAAVVVTNSQYSKRLIRELGVRQQVTVVGLGVDLGTFHSNDDVKNESSPTLLCVGRLGHNKNHSRLLRVVSDVRNRVPDVRLWIVGSGPDHARLKAEVTSLDLEKHVRFLGHVFRQDLAERMRRAWVFTLFSDKEGLGVVFMEAQASGLPCVGPRVGGVPEVVEEGTTGKLIDFNADDGEEKASDSIVELLRNSGLRLRMSSAAADRANRMFDEDEACARVANLVDRVAKRTPK